MNQSSKKLVSENIKAFTLLEVMIAMAILAMVLVTAFWSQSRSVALENEAKWNTISGTMIQTFVTETLGTSTEDLKDNMFDLLKGYPNFNLRFEMGSVPFSELPDLMEFIIELQGPTEGLSIRKKFLLYVKKGQ